MGVFARLLRRGGSTEEGTAAKQATEESAESVAAPASGESGESEEGDAVGGGIPKQQSAKGAADSDAGDEARK